MRLWCTLEQSRADPSRAVLDTDAPCLCVGSAALGRAETFRTVLLIDATCYSVGGAALSSAENFRAVLSRS